MTNETTYTNVIIGAAQTGLLAIIAEELLKCEYLYAHTNGYVSSTIRCMKDVFSTDELKALCKARLICNSSHNSILFRRELGNIVKKYAQEDSIKLHQI
jgi:hypothetical protein